MAASPNHQPEILLICGMPASGKTSFGNWLGDRFNFIHLDLESRNCLSDAGLPPFWPERIWNLDQGELSRFFSHLRSMQKDIVLTWAFHTDLIPFVAQLVQQGATPWWFEADRLALRLKYVQRGEIIRDGISQTAMPDLAAPDRYVATLVDHWSQIAPIFGGNIVYTLGYDGKYVEREKLWALMQRR